MTDPDILLRERELPADAATDRATRLAARGAFVRAHRGETPLGAALVRHGVPLAFVGVALLTVTWATFAADAVLR